MLYVMFFVLSCCELTKSYDVVDIHHLISKLQPHPCAMPDPIYPDVNPITSVSNVKSSKLGTSSVSPSFPLKSES